ncbi:efflux RND transporter periplasmic adaptor subunit [Bradyrhizobium sp. 162]|uniref:efflux RND transporter periplasmic adaptor subunit n=1 Tax=Bradyrhizobium sp. 162 TaxID=2782635 RepID=UPI001FF999AC|nr:efflux RND transporter periplasmic adaptor subunit [Bradyrhizobium sp. 162]MCK1634451.1 efflux RND transporter periplasmic adaptor subunit [Bradyrhizobium sp. 162]
MIERVRVARLAFTGLGFAAGIAVASLAPGLPQSVRKFAGLAFAPATVQSADTAGQPPGEGSKVSDDKQAIVNLTDEQLTEARIDLAQAESGILAHRIIVPGTIIPVADRIARVAVKLSGTVAELRKNIGDSVIKGEVLAILESREVADAKSEYLAARLTNELQQTLFQRDRTLWEGRAATEQQFLRSRNLTAQTEMKLNVSRQKLFALGLSESEIAALPNEPEALLRRQEVRAPMAGRVVERKVDLGMAVGRDNLETELFVIVDLDRVWVELAVSPTDLPAIKEGQPVSIAARGIMEKADGKIMFITPLVDKESRSARVVAEVANESGAWRPGSFVTAAVPTGEQPVSVAVPASAVQTIGAAKAVFVRTAEGFEKRAVVTGRSDDRLAEVLTGLKAGETIAVTNTFLLKAEFLKSSAEE